MKYSPSSSTFGRCRRRSSAVVMRSGVAAFSNGCRHVTQPGGGKANGRRRSLTNDTCDASQAPVLVSDTSGSPRTTTGGLATRSRGDAHAPVMRLTHDLARREGICVEEHDAQGEAALHVPVASAPGDFVSFRLDSRNPQLARLPFLCPRRADLSAQEPRARGRLSPRSTVCEGKGILPMRFACFAGPHRRLIDDTL